MASILFVNLLAITLPFLKDPVPIELVILIFRKTPVYEHFRAILREATCP